MAKSKAWDSTLKRLVRADPAAFVQWLLPGATFIAERPVEVESLKREVDVLHEVTINEQSMLLHIEFQTYNDTAMANRLLVYNVLLMSVYKLPVLSCVIYLLQDGTVQSSPLHINVPSGHLTHVFYFESIEIGQLTAQDIMSMANETLLALVPLTRDGMQQAVLERLFEELNKQREPGQAQTEATEVEMIAFTLASFALQRKNKTVDLEWLKRRFREMHDTLEDSPIYQMILQEGLEKGLEKGRVEGRVEGREEGMGQGRLEATRHILLILTERRFPALATLAEEQAALVDDVELLNSMIVTVGSALTEREAYTALRGQK